jgi:tripartite-type tricarboxylate transporter receptor subunit TctC
MKQRRRGKLGRLLIFLFALALVGISGAHADSYPNRPIRLIVPFGHAGT